MDTPTPLSGQSTARRRTSRLAVAALILSLIPLLFIYVIGLLLGAVAWRQISQRPLDLKGRGLAIGAVIIGSAWLVIQAAGLVSAIVLPGYANPQSASYREVKANLTDLAKAESEYRKAHGAYAGLKQIGWIPGGVTHYTYYLGDVVYKPAEGEPQPLDPMIGSVVNDQIFKAAAVANLDADPKLDVWIIVPNGVPVHVIDDSK